MTDPQQVIDEARPMLVKFLLGIGIYQPGESIADENLAAAFSDWLAAQEIPEDKLNYVASRVGAFICEYLIDGHNAARAIVEGRILLRVPTPAETLREFDPYAVAVGIVSERRSLKRLMEIVVT